MTIFVENETDYVFPFDPEKVAGQVVLEVLEEESCPYETEVNILITDNEGIRLYNREYRNIDRETDVLSFPNVPFEAPADFNAAEQYEADCFQPDSGELILGDIILSRDRILEQAESFGEIWKKGKLKYQILQQERRKPSGFIRRLQGTAEAIRT